jgi:hypothetical protein
VTKLGEITVFFNKRKFDLGLLKYLWLAYLHFFEKISFCTVMSLFEVKIVSIACASTCRIDTVDSTVEIKSTPA